MDSYLAELIRRYETVALRFLAGLTGSVDAAQDLYQDVVRAILESGKAFSSLDHLRNYFFVSLRHAAVDFARRRRRAREVQLPDDPDAPGSPVSPGPEDSLCVEEELEAERARLARLEASMASLSGAERELLRQRFWERRTFREIQEATGVPISTLKSREDAVLRKLKKAVGKEEAGT